MASIASSASGEHKYPVMTRDNYMGFTKNISYSVDQNRQAQDWATCGEVEGEFEYIIVADSHMAGVKEEDTCLLKNFQI